MSKFPDGIRKGDYALDCDICGCRLWASESCLLNVYTGRGGLRVCKNDKDLVDPGLIPYKIPSEKPVPFSRRATPIETTNTFPSLDTSIIDPLSGASPAHSSMQVETWEQLSQQTWDQWDVQWGS